MSLKGTLEAIGLEELLRAELASQGAGRLTLRNRAHYAALSFTPEGVYALQPDLLDAEVILRTFSERGLVDAEKSSKTRRRHLSDVILLDSLVEEGVVPEAELMEVLAAEVEDTVLDLMLWEEGHFHFERGVVDPTERGLVGRVCVDPQGVCDRARERLDERREIGDLLGDSALLFCSVVGELPRQEDSTDILAAVYARLDGIVTVHELALEFGVGRFEILRTIARLARMGLARPATPEELAAQATSRSEAGQHPVARALVLQWAEIHPDDEGPLRKLAKLAATCHDLPAEIEAYCALGDQHLQKGKAEKAVQVFTRAMRKAPADEVVLAGLKLAADAAGDNDSVVDGTLLMAQTRLDEGDAAEALDLLSPLLESHPDNMGLHLLRARALIVLEKRQELLEQAEHVGSVLDREGCTTQVDRETVEFFRSAINNVAPDRGDLLERFRALYDPRRARRRRLAISLALLLLIGSAGVYLWPASASALLHRAEEAAEAGDTELAGRLIAELTSKFPESDEVQQAVALQDRLFPPHSQAPRRVKAERELSDQIGDYLPDLRKALPNLPDQTAQSSARVVLELVESTRAKTSTSKALEPIQQDLLAATRRLLEQAVARVKHLSATKETHDLYRRDSAKLHDFLEHADKIQDAVWIADLRSTAELLHQLATRMSNKPLRDSVRDLARTTVALEKAAGFYGANADNVRLTLADLELEEADRACREEAPRLMVSGRLEQADALYARLDVLLRRYGSEPLYRDLIELLQRRQIPEFVRERRTQIADIRARIESAEAAEAKGDLDGAVAIYAKLIETYWRIRFENVFTIPLRVETLPPGAEVSLNGEVVGNSPAIVRYVWGSDARVRVRSKGWTTTERALRTAEESPSSQLEIRLTPATVWGCVDANRGTVGALLVGRHVLRADRGGAVTLHDGDDGHVRWSVRAKSLEGVRGRPALAGRHLYVPRVDGQVLDYDPEDGTLRTSIPVPRPSGDMAAQGEVAAVATESGELILLRAGAETARAKLSAVPTAGVVGAHRAFWVGTAAGKVVRVNSATGNRRVLTVAGGNVPVASLVATSDGILLTTAEGSLIVLAPDGEERWRKDGVGDLNGTPARAGKTIAVANRAGRVALFDVRSGQPRGTLELGAGAWHGLVGAKGVLMAGRKDGSFWAYDLAKNEVVADVPMKLSPRVPPRRLGRDRILLGLEGGCVGVIDVPRAP